jgi:hypothetical protein
MPSHSETTYVNVDSRARESQVGASTIALRGDALFHIAGDDLDKLDATTLKPLDTWTVTPHQFCVVQDGTLVVFASVHNSSTSAVYLIDAHDTIETLEGPIMVGNDTNVVLRGPTANEIYVTEGDHLVHLKFHGMDAEELPRLPRPSPNDSSREQLFGRGDGSVVGPGKMGGLAVVTSAGQVLEYPTPNRYVMHIVAGTQDRVWYSYAVQPQLTFAQHLVLVHAANPMAAIAKHDVSPGRIVHVGSGGGAAAALVLAIDMAAHTISWTVVVVEESGAVRWRADVPAAFTEGFTLSRGFVAINDRRVVLAGPTRVLVAWDAATGKVVS